VHVHERSGATDAADGRPCPSRVTSREPCPSRVTSRGRARVMAPGTVPPPTRPPGPTPAVALNVDVFTGSSGGPPSHGVYTLRVACGADVFSPGGLDMGPV
jgi:hypothetical protein